MEWRSSNKKFGGGGETDQGFVKLRFGILESMGLQSHQTLATALKVPVQETNLVNREILPLDSAEFGFVFQCELISREKDVELEFFGCAKLVLANKGSTWPVTDVGDDVEGRRPLGELHLPGGESREGNDDEEGAILLKVVIKVGEESASLNSLSETHLAKEKKER